MDKCTWKNCDRPLFATLLCRTHYKRKNENRDMDAPTRKLVVCAFDKCEKSVYSNKKVVGCKDHRHKVNRGNLSDKKDFYNQRNCDFDTCQQIARSKGLCQTHYQQLIRKGFLTPITVPTYRSITSGGYVSLLMPEHPCSGKQGRILEHRVVMEKTIGRPLLPEETVHHKNGDRQDNRPENLELWTGKHQPGVRVEDICVWAIEMLKLYKPDVLK